MSTENPDKFAAALGDALTQREDQNEEMLTAYLAMTNTQRKHVRIAAWYCSRGCLLADVFHALGASWFFQPAYVNSRGLNEAVSNAAGRSLNTSDGNRRWRARVYPASDLSHGASTFDAQLQCRHIRRLVPGPDAWEAITSGKLGRPRITTL